MDFLLKQTTVIKEFSEFLKNECEYMLHHFEQINDGSNKSYSCDSEESCNVSSQW